MAGKRGRAAGWAEPGRPAAASPPHRAVGGGPRRDVSAPPPAPPRARRPDPRGGATGMRGRRSRPGSRRPARSGKGRRAASAEVRPCRGKCRSETGAIAAPPRDGPASATWKRVSCRRLQSLPAQRARMRPGRGAGGPRTGLTLLRLCGGEPSDE
ncbi:uncharacterized protein LOC115838235 [Nomascus leucogenys]|uniref:uncharacterized protein LOC115838235 n=1 Tax=Nomascus leucogenys TaxID=61853 RepID=UPI00122D9DAC|nr:uncharacterized protein LOC115838235 [Nomascus leucogenys]